MNDWEPNKAEVQEAHAKASASKETTDFPIERAVGRLYVEKYQEWLKGGNPPLYQQWNGAYRTGWLVFIPERGK